MATDTPMTAPDAWDLGEVLDRAIRLLPYGCEAEAHRDSVCDRCTAYIAVLRTLRDKVQADAEARATWARADAEDHAIEDRMCRARELALLAFIRTGQ